MAILLLSLPLMLVLIVSLLSRIADKENDKMVEDWFEQFETKKYFGFLVSKTTNCLVSWLVGRVVAYEPEDVGSTPVIDIG